MDRLDDALRKALSRQDPGPEFTARVLARARAQASQSRRPRWFQMPNLRWVAAAAMVCVMVTAGVEYRERRERIEGEAAKEKLVTALRIAGTKLNQAREKVQELNADGRGGE